MIETRWLDRIEQKKQSGRIGLALYLLIFLASGMSGSEFLSYSMCQAQTQDLDSGIKVAQSLERAGQLEEAIEVYESLYTGTPRNVVVYSRLKDLYMRTQKYEKARRIIT